MSRPLEIRVPIAVFVAGAVLFVGAGALRDAAALTFPVIVAVIGLLAAAGLVARWHSGGMAAFVAAGLIALAHMLIALGDVHWGFRVLSGVLAAAHIYAAILVLTKPAREHLQGVPHE
ncbi:PGF-CTERM sorting domain-containing protein [Actinokineospora sp. UTMC 2448]|uniref:PGF-CTERM sorting domain-containing protein n=1 Tax=Actinokineospora sp. UTMC 2448 TaxID=2268449 RepID=UPI0021645916|nr:PGF-CTERM sorting domain-containing protein [Actinokineospora sp. UTMC 2448]UVS80877.1 hypothetical protein Actkin_04629 [Actinokineospora sp. UTMC 2448]